MKHLHLSRCARLLAAVLMAFLPSAMPCAENVREQMDFGVKAAKRGLWREALFRWEKALKLDPQNARLMNNLAVAYENSGQFEKADALYRQALRLDPGSRDIKQNYDLFSSYYKQILARRSGRQEPPSASTQPKKEDAPEPAPPPHDDAPPPR
ncbi:MAG: hypothetical protein DMH00_07800 [Acidobacteria bacterium]|nr:MAG: hypothetical protein DMH00_07800 [Acidobacteriota bacterium]